MMINLFLLSSVTETTEMLTETAAELSAEVASKPLPMLYDMICTRFDLYNTTAGNVLFVIGILLCVLIPYLIGSINPAIIFSHLLYKEDIRSYGSGNAGATNTLRTYGPKMAALIFVLDLLKAAIAVLLGSFILTRAIGGAIAALFVVLGHSFPIYYKFKGGKGVACTAMCILLLSPISFVFLLVIFLLIAVLTRYISLGSIICAMLFPLLAYVFRGSNDTAGFIPMVALLIGALVVFLHRENMKRLLSGKESKFSFKHTDKHKAEEHNGEETVAVKTETEHAEKEYSDDDFVKCSCGRIIPKSRRECVYCGAANPACANSEENKKSGKNKKK